MDRSDLDTAERPQFRSAALKADRRLADRTSRSCNRPCILSPKTGAQLIEAYVDTTQESQVMVTQYAARFLLYRCMLKHTITSMGPLKAML